MSDLAPATTPETDDAHFLRTQAADLERHWRGESMPPKWAGLVRREIEQLRRIADAAAKPRPIVELELLSRFRQGLAVTSSEHELICYALENARKEMKKAGKDIARLRRLEEEREEHIAAAFRALGTTEDAADVSLAETIARSLEERGES